MGLDNIQTRRRINLKPKSSSAIKKSNRKDVIEERRQNVRKKQEEVRRKLEDKNAQKEKLIKYAQDANPEDEERIKNDIAELEKEIQSDQMEIDKANKDIEMLDEEAGATDKESDDDDGENGDGEGNPGTASDVEDEAGSDVAAALAEAFRKGLQLGDNVRTYKHEDAALRPTQSILGYKRGRSNGKVAIVAECDVKNHQIYRIRRDIFVSSDDVDIIQTRRTGTGVLGKGDRGNIKWTADDIDDVVGIAIEVPPGYKGKPEDLVIPIEPLTVAQKEKIKAKGERVPAQADVQLIIRWKLPKVVKGISESYYLSFESRYGCYSIYGVENGKTKLYDIAKMAETYYRKNGGKYSVEQAIPGLKSLAMTPVGSREGSEEPDGEKNDKNQEEEKKKQEEEKKKQEEEKKKQEEEKKKQEEEMKKQEEEKQNQDEKSKKKNYESFFRSLEGIDPNAEFNEKQKEKFEAQYKKASAPT
ncbi:hypothetical protein VE00_09008 [Pseudogymnoascus sp. WSF 3629]|nr:hypothetical protein VE00_09008 [Pseudogymnoascus sp. WSF 3629]